MSLFELILIVFSLNFVKKKTKNFEKTVNVGSITNEIITFTVGQRDITHDW